MTCTRAQEFLAQAGVAIAETTIANNVRYPREAAIALAREAAAIWSTKGTKEVRLATAEASEDALAAALLGPSGFLRAPALRVGEVLVVGFSPAIYEEALGS